ncbi:EamA family transporter [Corynebacterium bovis]|uniref:EamA family transporter n=2 Tax=Corynebacterium bovis TaxID=36808 RepID=A0A3R8R382_9CORY|nr:EamA family transporter [Corynebacterium bovis]RRO87636.1 EamA family transporter [Corynebacterium bovis]
MAVTPRPRSRPAADPVPASLPPSRPRSASVGGVALVLGSCVSLQFGASAATHLFPSAGTWGTTSVRLVLAALVLLAATRPRVRSWDRRAWRAVVLLGVALGRMNGLFYASLDRVPLGVAVTVEFLGPLLLAAVRSRSARDMVWVVVAVVGVGLLGAGAVTGSGGTADGAVSGGAGAGGAGSPVAAADAVGLLLALGAGGFWVCYILTAASVGRRVPGTGGLAVAMAVGALVTLPLGARGAAVVVTDPGLVLLAAGTALLGSVVPYTLELAALRRTPPGVFGILLSLEPAVAALAGWVMLGQVLGVRQWVAVGLVVLASGGTTLSRPRPTRDRGA